MTKILAPGDRDTGQAGVPQTSPTAWISCCILGALWGAPFIAMLLWSLSTQALRSVLTLVFTTILVTMPLAVCARTWRRFFLWTFPLWVVAAAYSTCAIVSDKVPGRAIALLLSGTSWEEISGLFDVWQQKWMTLPIAGILALYLILAWRLPVWPVLSRKITVVVRVLLVLPVPMAVYAAQNFAQLTSGVALNPIIGSVMFFGVQMSRAHDELHGKLVVKTPFHAQRSGTDEEVHILIVGESARRAPWSAYGYTRAPTPYLDGLKKDGEAIFLQDAMSDANLTILAVPSILTGITPQEAAAGRHRGGNLLDLAKEAGYTTSWLGNQGEGGSTSLGLGGDHLEN